MLSDVLKELEGKGPKIAVGIKNLSGEKWEEFQVNHLCVADPRQTEKVHDGKWILQM